MMRDIIQTRRWSDGRGISYVCTKEDKTPASLRRRGHFPHLTKERLLGWAEHIEEDEVTKERGGAPPPPQKETYKFLELKSSLPLFSPPPPDFNVLFSTDWWKKNEMPPSV